MGSMKLTMIFAPVQNPLGHAADTLVLHYAK